MSKMVFLWVEVCGCVCGCLHVCLLLGSGFMNGRVAGGAEGSFGPLGSK